MNSLVTLPVEISVHSALLTNHADEQGRKSRHRTPKGSQVGPATTVEWLKITGWSHCFALLPPHTGP